MLSGGARVASLPFSATLCIAVALAARCQALPPKLLVPVSTRNWPMSKPWSFG